MTRHVKSGVKGHGYTAIQTDRRIKDAVKIAEGDAALRLVVDKEAQRVRGVQVEKDADGRALLNATLRALCVTAAVHEPRPLSVYVHAPAFVVLTCVQNDSQGYMGRPQSGYNYLDFVSDCMVHKWYNG